MDADLVYSQQIVGYGRTGDLLFAISTSGNSQNIMMRSLQQRPKD